MTDEEFSKKKLYLYVGLPMVYGEDSVTIEETLERLSYVTVHKGNIDRVIDEVRAEIAKNIY